MIKKSRGPKGPSVLPRSAQDEKGRPKRGPARDERPTRPSAPRRDDARPARFQRDDARSAGSARPARPAGPRREGDRPARPTGPRREGERPVRPDGPRRPDQRPARDQRDDSRSARPPRQGERSARPAAPRREGERPARPYAQRREGDRPARAGGAGVRSDRPYRPASTRPARPQPSDRPRGAGDDRRPPRFGADERGSKFQRDDRSRPRRDDGDRGSFDPRAGRRFAAPERYDAKTGRAIDPGSATATERPRSTKPGQTGGAPSATTPRRGPNVRDLALQVLFQVQVKRAFAERVIEELAEQIKLDRRDRGFMNELVKGTLRHRATLDWHLGRFLHVGLASTPVWIQNALRLGAYQLIHLDRIPPRAAVDETVKLALKYGHPGTAGLANSVLRRLAEAVSMGDLAMPAPTKDDGTPDWDALMAITSHPRWLLERWVPRYGIDDTLALCTANNRHARLGLRANRLRLDRKELLKRLEDAGLSGEPGRWSSHTVWVEADADFADFPAYARGDCTVQDESETMVGQLLAPKPGERVLDLCAAPGGKTTHLAELMGDSGEIVAVEKMAPRARTMKRQIERLGVKSVTVEVADGTTAELLSMGAGGLYDRALVDAPCSGLGVLARRADARWRKEASLFVEMAEVQAKLLRAAAAVVRPGGTLVYSVCSFEPEETDAIVASFLAEHPEWSQEHAATTLPRELVEESGAMRTLPHVHDVDGAFAVRLVRSKDRKAGG